MLDKTLHPFQISRHESSVPCVPGTGQGRVWAGARLSEQAYGQDVRPQEAGKEEGEETEGREAGAQREDHSGEGGQQICGEL